jgi:hypothetical protein
MTILLFIIGGNVVVYAGIWLYLLYAGIWLYLLKGSRDAESESFEQFCAAWQDSSYQVKNCDNTILLCIRFAVGDRYKYMVMNQHGDLVSKIKWESGHTIYLDKPSSKQKKLLEVYTTQIATMRKLEHNL